MINRHMSQPSRIPMSKVGECLDVLVQRILTSPSRLRMAMAHTRDHERSYSGIDTRRPGTV